MADERDFLISPSQAFQLMSLSELVKSGDLIIRSSWDCDEEHEESVTAILADVAQELALQVDQGDGGQENP